MSCMLMSICCLTNDVVIRIDCSGRPTGAFPESLGGAANVDVPRICGGLLVYGT